MNPRCCRPKPPSPVAKTPIDTNNPSMLLGAIDLAPVEMADAFSTIARVGSRVPLHAVKFVTDDKGRLVSAGDEIKPVQVFHFQIPMPR